MRNVKIETAPRMRGWKSLVAEGERDVGRGRPRAAAAEGGRRDGVEGVGSSSWFATELELSMLGPGSIQKSRGNFFYCLVSSIRVC